ncbi:MAG: hypothetical protein A3J46_06550 [Candidatus Yanofskybacteria bacterium RIFCSPHIGHO2_02_FULL_41_11]|uniref:Uncharacterized protein n=1 Tax=Candidatus Yanofskybacteria bacterium RIFCSPHIGHO2_02_FULL_41_11 TaxID=1802675 RepID=A0A1F8F6C6_9BACT|nr:MAG: hypothetical protein A3J46_06550 [Candidatus Yanofskybacteria bacterium RIFCSPHIGHO2_02_FULL_41_11]
MKVYWNDRNKKAELLEEIERDGAQPWDNTEPKSHVMIGVGRIFINPSDYGIDGYSLSAEDLEALLKELRDKSTV